MRAAQQGGRIRVALHGDGQLARGLRAQLEGVEILGPAAHDPELLRSGAELVVIATTTRLADVAADIELAVESGSNVIVSAEEAAFPWNVDERIARRVDALARERGVTVLGGGLNPGLLFDALVLTLLGAHGMPRAIRVTRVVDVSRFGPAVRARLGLGVTARQFEAGWARGEILGHAGFAQSMRVVGDAIGLPVERIEGEFEPILGPDGRTVGFRQLYTGSTAGRAWFEAEFLGHTDLASAGLAPRDVIRIDDGVSLRTTTIEPGVPSQEGSVAMIANSIDRVLAAPPGWLTVAELPPARPRAGLIR